MSNRLNDLFERKRDILNVYVTAGYPTLESTVPLVQALGQNGVDLIELGMPFSDPLADGPVIQSSSEIAIKNGVTLDYIFNQVDEIRKNSEVPILLMGYYNQLLSYGVGDFLKRASEVGVDGLIIPDLPLDYYQKHYKSLFEGHGMKMSFLVTPQTADERIKEIAQESTAFLYVVSSYAITGGESEIQAYQTTYFERIKAMNLKVPMLIGFGIKDKASFQNACQYADGAIIGSAFIRQLQKQEELNTTVEQFISSIK